MADQSAADRITALEERCSFLEKERDEARANAETVAELAREKNKRAGKQVQAYVERFEALRRAMHMHVDDVSDDDELVKRYISLVSGDDTYPKGRILCIDFDGVLHKYTSPWTTADEVRDDPVPGAFAWLTEVIDKGFVAAVYSSRSQAPGGVGGMKAWFQRHGFERRDQLIFPRLKPPAWLTIDDRAICFTGTFPSVEEMLAFKPWNKRRRTDA